MVQEALKNGRMPRIRKNRRLWLLGTVVVALLVAVSAGIVLLRDKKTSPFSDEMRRSTAFPLYYPTQLPEGMVIERNSITSNSQAVLYRIVSAGDEKLAINVSLQARPQDLAFETFYQQRLLDVTALPTANGIAKIGKINQDNLFGSLTTSKTWIIVSATDSSMMGPLKDVLKAMRKDR